MHRPRAVTATSLAARQGPAAGKRGVRVVYPYITLTDFGKNTIRAAPVPADEQEPTVPFPPDSAEFVAGKIAGGIVNGEAGIFSHDRMKERRA